MHLEIISINSSSTYNVESVHFTGKSDSFSILNNHAPLVKNINDGTLHTKGNNPINIYINKGVIKVFNNHISVISY